MSGRKLDTVEAAALAGVKPGTWRSWRSRGLPAKDPVPAPDGWRELWWPWWWEETIIAWLKRRHAAYESLRSDSDAGR